MSLEAIKQSIPHREPFLLVDEIVEKSEKRIVCRKKFTGEEFWYRGHYPGQPLTPGVLLCEAAMQAGAVLLSDIVTGQGGVPVVARMNNVKFKAMVQSEDTIQMQVELTEQMAGAYFFKARVSVAGNLAVTLDFACKMVQAQK